MIQKPHTAVVENGSGLELEPVSPREEKGGGRGC